MPTFVRTEEKVTAELRVRIWPSPAQSPVSSYGKGHISIPDSISKHQSQFPEQRLLFVRYRLWVSLEAESIDVLVTRTKKLDLSLNSWQFLALYCVSIFSCGVVPGSFIGLHHFTASFSGRGEFERLKFVFSWKCWGGCLLVSTSLWRRSFLFHLTQLHKLNLCSRYRAKRVWWSHDWLTVY